MYRYIFFFFRYREIFILLYLKGRRLYKQDTILNINIFHKDGARNT